MKQPNRKDSNVTHRLRKADHNSAQTGEAQSEWSGSEVENPSANATEVGAGRSKSERKAHGKAVAVPAGRRAVEIAKAGDAIDIFGGGCDLSEAADWQNARDLLEHLRRCHRAVLYSPGIKTALRNNERCGVHTDPAFRLIDGLLYGLECALNRRRAAVAK
jgi:hypothetical protein